MFEVSTGALVTTVTISGALDLSAREQFHEVAAKVTGMRHRLLTFDLCDVPFMDSSGAAFLISLAEAGQRKGWMTVLRGCNENNRFVLEICDALDLFRVDEHHRCPHINQTLTPAGTSGKG